MVKLELLAPAKDLEHGKAAINHGADAVYIGSPKFSARKAAGTTLSQIEELAKYAHFFKARVYVALNTILYDNELDEAEKLINDIYNSGADALIIQDMGILEMSLPPIPLFASTQTHNTTPEKVKFLENTGFKRVILARELSLEQIQTIRKETSVDLESFVHGALCVSYSGQCYMSQSVCGRSGNRGDCAQPCRSAYDLVDSKGKTYVKNKHLISLKDLNLSHKIPDLIQAGITSFKIEGRLKDMSYVKNIVSHYRQTIDSFIEDKNEYGKASSGKSIYSFSANPDKTFNRGYTGYNINGREDKIATFHTQKAIGAKVGEIKKIAGNKLMYQGEKLNAGDGICFFTKENELKGFNVNRFEAGYIVPSNSDSVYEGAVLYRNFDIAFENELKQSQGNRKVRIDIKISGNEYLLNLSATDEDGISANFSKELQGVKANNPVKAEEVLRNQLGKLGSSSFQLGKLEIELTEIPFLQVSQINEFRRELVDLLTEQRLKNYTHPESAIAPNDYPFPITNLDYRANIANRLAEKFYTRHQAVIYEKAYELNMQVKEEVVMVTKHCIRHHLDACLLTCKDNPLKEPLYLKDQNTRYRLKFNCKDCEMLIIKEKL